MSRFCYRDATASDAEALGAFAAAAFADTFGPTYPPADLAAFLAAKYNPAVVTAEIADPATRYRLAFDDEGLAGFCMMGALDLPVSDDGALELHRLYVHERVKGEGVAAVLLEEAFAWARERGARAIYLSVGEHNVRAQRFYRRHGFKDHSEWKFMVGSIADRDFIWKLTL